MVWSKDQNAVNSNELNLNDPYPIDCGHLLKNILKFDFFKLKGPFLCDIKRRWFFTSYFIDNNLKNLPHGKK